MPTWAWILIAVAVLAVIAIVAWAAWSRHRTTRLRDSFGPEYDHTVDERGDRREAERDLMERRRHRESLDVRPLEPEARRRYEERWQGTQATFVDSPALAISEADVLVQSVMRDRGYPIDDADRRMADVSVDHPDVMDRFRSASAVATASRQAGASTEDLRRAMVDYRELFGRLLADDGEAGTRRTA
jgi:hypothetical protein